MVCGYSKKPLIPIDQIINYISLPFAVFYQNSNWAVDYLYGLQNELYKICADIFGYYYPWLLLKERIFISLNQDYLFLH